MYLLITAIAAVVSTVVWYVQAPVDKYRVRTLCFVYWGASLMWLIDSITTAIEGEGFFEVSFDAALLGITAVLAGLIVWLVILLIKDPKGVFKRMVTQDK